MCGEIQDWQKQSSCSIRVTTGIPQNIPLPKIFDEVEEIRIDEFMITNFNGGISGTCYVQMEVNSMNNPSVNNDQRTGTLLIVDVLNPKTVYQRPRVVAASHPVTVNQISFRITNPDGSTTTFNEASFVLTIVMRKSEDELAEVRRLKAQVDYLPSIKDVKTTFQP